MFVKFDYSYKEKDISMLLKKILSKFKPETIHGSRDYYQIKHNNLVYELVPVLDIKESDKAVNVTDMSPMHVSWVKKNLKKGMADEIRLAKKFCKSIGAYGAESYIRGFSGHVIDILVIYYGSFLNLLKESLKWKEKTYIDTEKYYKSKNDALFHLNKSKTSGPLIVIDPILKTRNAASAVSSEKFHLFKKKAKEFLKNPSIEYFIEKKISADELIKEHKKICIVKAFPKKGKSDIIGSKLLKSYKYIESELKKRGFKIKNSGWHWDKKDDCIMWFKPEKSLDKIIIIKGPPLEMKEACKRFKEKYKECFKKGSRLFAKEKRKSITLGENLKEILETPYIKERTEGCKIVFDSESRD